MLSWCWQKFYRLAKDRRGVAYIEFALALPFLILFVAGIVDLTRMLLLHQKVDKAAFTMNDLITQLQTQTGVCNLIDGWSTNVIPAILQPFQFDAQDYQLRVTSVLGTGNPGDPNGNPVLNRLEWTWINGSRGQQNYNSVVPNDTDFPLALQRNERVIRVEIFYKFRPFLPFYSMTSDAPFRKASFMVPRATVGGVSQNYWLHLGPPTYVTGGALSNCS